jgi:hypothetical protein
MFHFPQQRQPIGQCSVLLLLLLRRVAILSLSHLSLPRTPPPFPSLFLLADSLVYHLSLFFLHSLPLRSPLTTGDHFDVIITCT